MSKFKVRFKIQGLELEIDGERDAIPQVTAALHEQFGNLLSAPQAIADPVSARPVERNITPVDGDNEPVKRRGRKARTPKADSGDVAAIDFRHDVEKWGNPLQSWTTAQKAIWLLFIVGQQSEIKAMSAPQIAVTFNKHFRHAKMIHQGNVTRDLGKERTKPSSLVGEDNNKSPAVWYLTQSGSDYAQKLSAEAKGGSSEPSQAI